MEIILDFSFFEELVTLPLYLIVWKLFIYGGWVVVLFFIFVIWYTCWLKKKQKLFLGGVTYVLLAVDVPKDNELGPLAVENIFAQLAAAESGAKTFKERNWRGVMETPVSLELISMEGYIQFLVRIPVELRDLAETAVYAQYPDAEITEVEDYVGEAPTNFPSAEHDLWGTDLVLYNNTVYPIRTYKEFEDMTALERFKDPMASILEAISKIGRGENIWLQILLVPAQPDWVKEGGDVIKKILKIPIVEKPSALDTVLDAPLQVLRGVHEQVWGNVSEPPKEPQPGKPGDLTPGDRKVLEAVQNKMSKIGFKTKVRFVYWGKKDVFSKGRGVAAFMGAFKQFSSMSMNGFMPDKKNKTSGEGLSPAKNLAEKQNNIIKYYAARAFHKGAKPFILNTEELATIYHFPVKAVKAPLLKMAEVRRGEAPVSLPIDIPWVSEEAGATEGGEAEEVKGAPPEDLPTG